MVQQHGGPGGRGPINVDVQRATVRQADVTRMSMSGDTNGAQEQLLKEIGDRLTGRDSLKESLEGIREAVEACCVAGGGGGRASAEGKATDAMHRTSEASGDVADTMEALKKSMEVLISATQQMSTSASDSGSNMEAGAGLQLAAQKAQQKQFEALSNMMFKMDKEGEKLIIRFGDLDDESATLRKGFKTIGQGLREVKMTEYVKFLNQSTQGLQNFVSDLTDVTAKMREAINQFKQDMETSRSGLISVFDLFTSELQNIGRLIGGEFADSTRMVIEAVQRAGGAPGLMFGRSLEEQGKILHDIRSEIIDSRMRTMVGFEGVTDNIIKQYDVARRRGLRGEQAELFAQKRARQELNLMMNIMQNTGMTADAVADLMDKQTSDFENLVAGGAVNERQRELLRELRASTMGQSEWGEKLMTEMMESRFSIVNMDQNLLQKLQVLGVLDDYIHISEQIRDGNIKDSKRILGAFSTLGDKLAAQEQAFLQDPSREALLKANELTSSTVGGMANDLRGLLPVAENTGKGTGWLVSLLDEINEWIKKYFPVGLAGLGIAIVAHTLAMAAHTKALLFSSGGLRSLFSRGPKGGPRGPGPGGRTIGLPKSYKGPVLQATTSMGAQVGPAAANVAGAGMGAKAMSAMKAGGKLVARAAAPVTGAMVLKDVYDVATGDTSGENIGALVGSAIGGAIGFLTPIPGGMLIGAGIGNWLGEMAGAAWDERKAAKAAMDRQTGRAIGTTATQTAGPGGTEIARVMERAAYDGKMGMQEQTSLLRQMAGTLESIAGSNQAAADGIKGMRGVTTATTSPSIQAVAGTTK